MDRRDKDRLKLASELWPPIRLAIIDDDALEGIWIEHFPELGKEPAGNIDCKCDPDRWQNGVGAVCDSYEPFSDSDRDCRHCDHAEACHYLE